jgi:hypothetical protein
MILGVRVGAEALLVCVVMMTAFKNILTDLPTNCTFPWFSIHELYYCRGCLHCFVNMVFLYYLTYGCLTNLSNSRSWTAGQGGTSTRLCVPQLRSSRPFHSTLPSGKPDTSTWLYLLQMPNSRAFYSSLPNHW